MDYSSSIHDADNPAGASPWGSSPVPSPQHARTSSFPTSGDVPPSPIPYNPTAQAAGYSNEDIIGGGGYQRPESSTGTDSVTESDGRRPDTAESVRSSSKRRHSSNIRHSLTEQSRKDTIQMCDNSSNLRRPNTSYKQRLQVSSELGGRIRS